MSIFWSDIVGRLAPYVPGEQPKVADLVKLNTNENPYPPSPKALAAMAAEVSGSLRLYPDPNSDQLRHAIAKFHHVEANNVFVGNGSDEVLAHVFMGLLKHERPLLYPDVTYSFYPVYCGLYDVDHVTVPLDEEFGINVDDYLERDCGAVILANPNAPTSRALSLEEVERLVAGKPDVVIVIDEAYVDFGAESAVPLVKRYPNLLVIHTLSKSRSLAGLRVGFAIGHPDLIEALERVKNCFNSYPLDRMAIAGGTAAMEDVAYFETTRQRVMASRDALAARMTALGFRVLPSAANFIFAEHPERDGAELARELRERHILVRHFKLPRIKQFLRITVGTDEQCNRLTDALAEILGR